MTSFGSQWLGTEREVEREEFGESTNFFDGIFGFTRSIGSSGDDFPRIGQGKSKAEMLGAGNGGGLSMRESPDHQAWRICFCQESHADSNAEGQRQWLALFLQVMKR